MNNISAALTSLTIIELASHLLPPGIQLPAVEAIYTGSRLGSLRDNAAFCEHYLTEGMEYASPSQFRMTTSATHLGILAIPSGSPIPTYGYGDGLWPLTEAILYVNQYPDAYALYYTYELAIARPASHLPLQPGIAFGLLRHPDCDKTPDYRITVALNGTPNPRTDIPIDDRTQGATSILRAIRHYALTRADFCLNYTDCWDNHAIIQIKTTSLTHHNHR